MTEDGFLCTGVAERHILQLPFIGFGFRNGSAALEAEGLRVVQVFEDRANVPALVFRTGQVTQNTRHPLGKGGDGGKVQQEFRSAQVFLDRHGNQEDVGYRVSQNTCNPLDQIRLDISLFPLQDEIFHQPKRIIIDVLEPIGNTKNADILGKLNRTGFTVDIAEFLPVCTMLLPVVVIPFVRVPMAQEADRRSDQGDEDQDDVHIGQHRQIHRKAENIGQKARQGLPDMLRSLSVIAGSVRRYFQQLLYLGVRGVRIRSGKCLVVDGFNDSCTQIQLANQFVGGCIILQRHQNKEQNRKAADGGQQFRERRCAFHLLQNLRGHI